jgi:hypothetical protein
MTDPTISVKGLIKLGFEEWFDDTWKKDLVNDFYMFIVIRDGEPCEGGIEADIRQGITFDSITYKQAKAIIEVFGTRF